MDAQSRPDFIRYAGNLEKVSIARHALGLLNPVAVTARYQLPILVPPGMDFRPLFDGALRVVIDQHPALRCGIIDQDRQNPAFVRLDTMNIERHLFIIDEYAPDVDAQLKRLLSSEHSLSMTNLATCPAWRLLVVFRGSDEGLDENSGEDWNDAVLELCFVFHHTLIDGLSGLAFHQSLLNALNNVPMPRTGLHNVDVSDNPPLAPSVEQQLRLKKLRLRVTSPRLISEFLDQFRPEWTRNFFSAWTGSVARIPPNTVNGPGYSTKLDFFHLSSSHFREVRKKCRKYGMTFTAMMHSIIVFALLSLQPNARTFIATTPYSVRSFTGTSSDEVVNQYCVSKTLYPRRFIKSIRRHPRDSQGLFEIASYFSRDLEKSRRKFPVNSTLSLLEYVSNFQTYFRNKLGKAREATFEVSNLGAFCDSSREPNIQDDTSWKITHMLFTQSGSVTGNAFSFNVASVEDGPLTMSMTWQDVALDPSLARNIFLAVQSLLKSLCRTDQTEDETDVQ